MKDSVQAFLDFSKANDVSALGSGLDAGALLVLSRSLAICTLGNQRSRLEFDVLQRALCLPSGEAGHDETEAAVLDALQLGLLDARIDEENGCVDVLKSTVRSFDSSQWPELADKIGALKFNVDIMMEQLSGDVQLGRPAAAVSHNLSSASKAVAEFEAIEAGAIVGPQDFLGSLEGDAVAEFD